MIACASESESIATPNLGDLRWQGLPPYVFDLPPAPPMPSCSPAEPWSKTLGRNAALEYTRDSPMFRKRLWAFQETLKPLEGYTMKILDRVENYCKVKANASSFHLATLSVTYV